MKSVKRFTGRVSNYIKYRPGYPPEIIRLLSRETGFDEQKDVADIGSGTGKLSKLFLANDNLVYGVEPNDEMREAGEKILKDYINFISINGTAENTMLADECVDFVISGQAFHLFDTEKAKQEFIRILKHNGYCILVWNERELDSSTFMKSYEKLLLKYGTDYTETRHENIEEKVFNKFYGVRNFKLATYANSQVFDYNGLKGRLLSSSYVPFDSNEMLEELKKLFDKHNNDGKLKFDYITKIYFGRIKK